MNNQANIRITKNNLTWVPEFLAITEPRRATINLPPGNVGIGNSEIHPKNVRTEPAFANGCAQASLMWISSKNASATNSTISGGSIERGAETNSTNSGVRNNPMAHKTKPLQIIIDGAISDIVPNCFRLSHGRELIRGNVEISNRPKGHINDDGEINIAIEMISAPIITEKEVILQEIYFAFDKSDVTEQGKVELDKLVKVMNENSKMVIAVNSHTDNQGSEQYNLNLSQRRANATVQYIISKGIAKERVSGKGYGESQLKVDCLNNGRIFFH